MHGADLVVIELDVPGVAVVEARSSWWVRDELSAGVATRPRASCRSATRTLASSCLSDLHLSNERPCRSGKPSRSAARQQRHVVDDLRGVKLTGYTTAMRPLAVMP